MHKSFSVCNYFKHSGNDFHIYLYYHKNTCACLHVPDMG